MCKHFCKTLLMLIEATYTTADEFIAHNKNAPYFRVIWLKTNYHTLKQLFIFWFNIFNMFTFIQTNKNGLYKEIASRKAAECAVILWLPLELLPITTLHAFYFYDYFFSIQLIKQENWDFTYEFRSCPFFINYYIVLTEH